MFWTKEKPTKPGYYWQKQHFPGVVNGPWDSVSVVQIDIDECLKDGSLWVWIMGGEGHEPLEDYRDSCEWAGPIPEPVNQMPESHRPIDAQAKYPDTEGVVVNICCPQFTNEQYKAHAANEYLRCGIGRHYGLG